MKTNVGYLSAYFVQMDYTYTDVRQKFIEIHKTTPMLVRSPARINLIGEHTDYNDGFVMPAAIDKEIVFAIAPSNDNASRIYALNFDEHVEIDSAHPNKVNTPRWVNYLLGVMRGILDKDKLLTPFNCVFGGNIPAGSGVSSSAALECGFAFALNELNQLALSKIDLIKISQWAEHNYAGVKCGIMDQYASMMGKKDHVFVLDCRSLQHHYFPLALQEYVIVLLDTNVKHSLADSEYNTRRKECEKGVSILQQHYPSISSLRDVTQTMLEKHRNEFDETVYQRCFYVVSENIRVQAASNDLVNHNIPAFGAKMFETHEGLSKLYAVSCRELDFLVEQVRNNDNVLGARMMGGGFGGCTINIIKREAVDNLVERLKKTYYDKFNLELKSYLVQVNDGSGFVVAGHMI